MQCTWPINSFEMTNNVKTFLHNMINYLIFHLFHVSTNVQNLVQGRGMCWSLFADPSCIKAKFKERVMLDTSFHNIFHSRKLKKKKKKKSCHLSNNYNKVTERLKWYISKFRLKPHVCFYSIAIIMIIVIFF